MTKPKKKLPSSITILGRKYKIKQGKGLVWNGQTCLGLCDNTSRIIYLEKEQDDQTKKETLLHECVHALLFISGFDQRLSESENEVYCQIFTAFYHDMESAISGK
jgi:Zn-dependent peptidase ImmA (M78 family)